MNTIYKVSQKPYILDPFPLGKGYLFPTQKKPVNKNKQVNFTSNNPFTKVSNEALKRQTAKLKELQAELKNQTQKGQQLNTIA